MHSLKIDYLKHLKFSAEQLATLKKIGEYKGKQELFSRQTPEILDSLQQLAMIESNISSNRLEGVTAPLNRVRAIVLKSTTPANRPEQEIAGYRDALSYIHDSASQLEYSTNTILQLHSMVYRYLPEEHKGRWKRENNIIIERSPDGTERVRFRPVSVEDTPGAMIELVKRYRAAINELDYDPMIVIPLVILDFLCIHPFKDGNGRLARLTTLLLLYHFDFKVGRYISLERIFEESKETYYETLETCSQNWHEGTHDVFPWMNYFWGVILRAYGEFEERVGSIHKSKGSKTERIKIAVDNKLGPFSISELENDLPGISRDMIRVVLRQLREEGVLTLQGTGRYAKWLKTKD